MTGLVSSFSGGASFAESKKNAVVSLRWVLVLAACALILFHARGNSFSHVIILGLISTNFILTVLPAELFIRKSFDGLLVVADIVFVSLCIWVTGSAQSDFFLLYFLVIMVAAVSETSRSLLWSAGLVALTYLVMVFVMHGPQGVLDLSVLVRLPFFLMVAVFYGHLTQRVRAEKTEKISYKTKLNLAAQVRRLSMRFARKLDRKQVLREIVRAEKKFCRARYVAIFSRGNERILFELGSKDFGLNDLKLRVILKEIERNVSTKPEDSESKRRIQALKSTGFTLLPFGGQADADLYLCLAGEFPADRLEYAQLLLLSGVLALKNAGEYRALLNEVEQRQQVVRQLGQALDFRSLFVANVSHELRTPVNALIGFGDLLLDGGYGELAHEQETAIRRMVENAAELRGLINNILDFSKLEAQAFKVQMGPRNLEEFLTEIIETCAPLVREKPLALLHEFPEGDIELVTDWGLLRQIALNLVSNAIKFTEHGQVLVVATVNIEGGELSLSVRDTGIGIDKADFERIFEPFKQVENAYTKRYAGTGLGLSITKRQVQLLKGRINVVSERGKGTEFIVTVPVGVRLLTSADLRQGTEKAPSA